MYAYIKGIVEDVLEDCVIIDNNGIGYRIFVPSSALGEMQPGEEQKLYTYFSVKEDALLLFGFLTRDDLEMYRMLLKVSGIGPKGAMGVLSVMSADDIRFAVLSDDAEMLSKAPGVGKKSAQKIILELRDKLDLETAFTKKAAHTDAAEAKESGSDEQDAVLALVSLGYGRSEAVRAVRKVRNNASLTGAEDIIKAALREL